MASRNWTPSYNKGTVVLGFLIIFLYLCYMLVKYGWVIKQFGLALSRLLLSSRLRKKQDEVQKGIGLSKCGCCHSNSTYDESETHARRLAMKQQAVFRRHVLGFALHIAMLLLVIAVAIRATEVLHGTDAQAKPSSDLILLAAFIALVGMLQAVAPQALTVHRMNLDYTLVMGRLTWQLLDMSEPFVLVFQSHGVTATTIAISLWLGNFRLICWDEIALFLRELLEMLILAPKLCALRSIFWLTEWILVCRG